MLERSFLVLCTIVWLPYGVVCFFDPSLVADLAGITASSATGTTEIRAMYGGLQAAVGVLATIALFRPTLFKFFLVTLLTLSAGLFSARVAGYFLDGGYTGYTGMAIGFEAALLSSSLYFLYIRRRL